MNAGAEYVLYRILGALQDEEGIHPESLLTCLGALAGYACRHAAGDALNRPLTQSPMSVWALVRRAVQKLGRPLPNFDERMPRGHRPRRPAVVYLKQLWPQVLPIAQRFCRKPTQLPVLFGIALQRAIELTLDVLSPTLSARIAMDCAIAMSRVALPGEILAISAKPPVLESPSAGRLPPAAAPPSAAPSPIAAAPSGMRAEPRTPAASAKRRVAPDVSAPNLWARVASRPGLTLLTIAFLGVITVAVARWKPGQSEGIEPAPVERKLQVATAQPGAPLFAEPTEQAEAIPEAPARQDAEPIPPPPSVAQEDEGPAPTAAEATEARINEESQRQLDANATGDSEMVPITEFAASPRPQPPSSIPAESLF
jgi:hypothetical protein